VVMEYTPSTMGVVMRSVMFTPGNNAELVGKARNLTADVMVLDLEDSVPPTEKNRAREVVAANIKLVAESGGDVYARVNAWDSGLLKGDLEAIVQPGLNGIVIPKTETPDDPIRADRLLTELEKNRGMAIGTVKLQLLIESARGVLAAYECGKASSRVNSLVFGAVDYTRDMRVKLTGTGEEVQYSRSAVAVAARAAGIVAIDPPWPGFRDTEGFVRHSSAGAQLGYEGRMLIHPNQIEPAQEIYGPSEADVEHARKVVEVFEQGMKEGKASVALEGSMVDWAVYRAEMDLLAKVDLIAEKEARKKANRKA